MKIDRRTFATVQLDGEVVDKTEVYAYEVARDQRITLAAGDHSTLWYVDSGPATLELGGQPAQQIQEGATFAGPKGHAAKISVGKNRASTLISFRLLNSR